MLIFFLFSQRVQILETEYKYGQILYSSQPIDCRYFFVIAIIILIVIIIIIKVSITERMVLRSKEVIMTITIITIIIITVIGINEL